MLTILFWNVGMRRAAVASDAEFLKRLLDSTARMATEHGADFVILAECTENAATVEELLNANAPGGYSYSEGDEHKLAIFVRSLHE